MEIHLTYKITSFSLNIIYEPPQSTFPKFSQQVGGLLLDNEAHETIVIYSSDSNKLAVDETEKDAQRFSKIPNDSELENTANEPLTVQIQPYKRLSYN